MATVQLTTDNFNEVVSGPGTVIVDFWASWCRPCVQFAPVFDDASERHDDIVFAKVDTEDQTDLATAFEIRSIPTLMALRDGVILYSEAGALQAPAFEELIGKIRAVDMEQVRASIAEQQEQEPSSGE